MGQDVSRRPALPPRPVERHDAAWLLDVTTLRQRRDPQPTPAPIRLRSTCASCGGPLRREAERCDYCGVTIGF